ncbi:MAG: bifunctional folylpolyglutamate synthase/dihydrofolate synthase [Gammaproteobacteria bacterium]
MRFPDLESWLAWQETLHPSSIDLGLDRVAAVRDRMGLGEAPFRVALVGGTNGKGSTAALLATLLSESGLRTALYTSPHLVRYTERLRIDGAEVSPEAFVEAFDVVDRCRGGTSLTYFEFGTLAVLEICRRRGLDFAVLEVGLGGRLDAVNVMEPEVSVVTTVGLDHMDWLGPDRESIGAEKGGIFRPGRPAVIGDRDPPASLLKAAGPGAWRIGQDFDASPEGETWEWRGPGRLLRSLPRGLFRVPALLDNAASALAAFRALPEGDGLDADLAGRAIRNVRVSGRLQRVPGEVTWWLDVAHNPDAASVLADAARSEPPRGRTLAVLGMMADKDVEGVVAPLAGVVDLWFVAGLPPPRGLPAATLGARLRDRVDSPVEEAADVPAACARAAEAARPGDRVLALGSFQVVGPVLEYLGLYSAAPANG